jgi:acetylornithine deacetylase/succinyl-diaminopimelate desuccinylase-like protein
MILSGGRSSSMSNVDRQIQLTNAVISDAQMTELMGLLRIPSISADPAHAGDVRTAADWLVNLFQSGGAEAAIIERAGRPIVDARIRANDRADAPLVLCYGHFDVQSPAPVSYNI